MLGFNVMQHLVDTADGAHRNDSPLKNCCRYRMFQICSIRSGFSPITRLARSSTAPITARVFHSSDASPQPMSSGVSVSTLTNTQFRIRALTTTVEMRAIFMFFISVLHAKSGGEY